MKPDQQGNFNQEKLLIKVNSLEREMECLKRDLTPGK